MGCQSWQTSALLSLVFFKCCVSVSLPSQIYLIVLHSTGKEGCVYIYIFIHNVCLVTMMLDVFLQHNVLICVIKRCPQHETLSYILILKDRVLMYIYIYTHMKSSYVLK